LILFTISAQAACLLQTFSTRLLPLVSTQVRAACFIAAMPLDVRRRLCRRRTGFSQIRRGSASNASGGAAESKQSDANRPSLSAHRAAEPQRK